PLGVGDDLLEQLELPLDRRLVGGAGDVGTRGLHRLDELGRDRVGDRGEQQRDVEEVLCHRLRGGGGHGQRQVEVVGRELLGDGQGGGLLAVGVLLLELHL